MYHPATTSSRRAIAFRYSSPLIKDNNIEFNITTYHISQDTQRPQPNMAKVHPERRALTFRMYDRASLNSDARETSEQQ